jgi:hypothetical protein
MGKPIHSSERVKQRKSVVKTTVAKKGDGRGDEERRGSQRDKPVMGKERKSSEQAKQRVRKSKGAEEIEEKEGENARERGTVERVL